MTEFVELDAMKTIGGALESLSSEEKERVLRWALARYPFAGSAPSAMDHAATPLANGNSPAPKAKSKSGKKGKVIIKPLKDLNLFPEGKVSAVEFAGQKKPSNAKQKCVVAVYYLKETLEIEPISVDHVYTFFKAVSWPVPSDIKNVLQQAGTETWLDTADSSNILITATGENLVEHQLPQKKAD